MIGLGAMGAAIAARLERAGHELLVWNRSESRSEPFIARGAELLDGPAQALVRTDLCVLSLADDAAVEALTLAPGGVLAGAAGGTLVDMSTISAQSSARVAAAAADHGVSFLRAPVSGNPAAAAAGNLAIIVSGSHERFEALSSLLAEIGPNLFYVGAAEEARIVKLALNLMIGGTAELLAEAIVLGERHGIARADFLDVAIGSAIGSPFLRYKRDPLVAGDYRASFAARLLAKDLGLALAAAEEVGVPLPLTSATLALVRGCIAAGMGDDDLMALLPRLEQEAGSE